ncbi:hypothetical protein [Spirosoma endophyticum]|uniref:Uncharacterized protein n=1 Tax=Spirosoma endophyticum TaxID=662367 RepID=A0A1I1SMP6_9BACT|nr:hypothetical protein [Spirosoma endophyticum]SFD44300.1 hypothetical protein SAMN05216167_10561 [Spirosoma endophyticum]
MKKQALPASRSAELDSQAHDFNPVTGEQDPIGDNGIVKNIEEFKELLVESKSELVNEEGMPLTTDELKDRVDPDSPVGAPEVIP